MGSRQELTPEQIDAMLDARDFGKLQEAAKEEGSLPGILTDRELEIDKLLTPVEVEAFADQPPSRLELARLHPLGREWVVTDEDRKSTRIAIGVRAVGVSVELPDFTMIETKDTVLIVRPRDEEAITMLAYEENSRPGSRILLSAVKDGGTLLDRMATNQDQYGISVVHDSRKEPEALKFRDLYLKATAKRLKTKPLPTDGPKIQARGPVQVF